DLSTPPAAEPAPVAEAARFDEPFEAEAGADLHSNHVEDHESLLADYAEDEEALATEAGEEDDEEVAAEDEDAPVAAEELDAEAEDDEEVAAEDEAEIQEFVAVGTQDDEVEA